MKLLNYLYLVIFLSTLYLFIAANFWPTSNISPLSTRQSYLHQLQTAISSAGLTPIKLVFRDFQNQIEFFLITNHNKDTIKIILSTQKNPVWQVNQIKHLISNYHPTLIDLSPKHPYGTFQNN
ncbi:MAG: hypothetical protein WC686_02590 [Candidatus Shapirobacteria bacterium]|jgi:hypothetical protein